jgi:hypothetical protein
MVFWTIECIPLLLGMDRMTEQKKTKDEIIHDMCMTYRHDFGLLTDVEKTVHIARMRQILENAILPNISLNIQDLDKAAQINKEVWRRVETPIEFKYKEMTSFYQDSINYLEGMLEKSMEMNRTLVGLLGNK